LAQYLLTYLPRVGDDYLRWSVCDEKGDAIGNANHGTFAQAAEAADRKRVVMVVAGTEVLLEEAEVPATNLSKALKAVPYTLEEHLAQDVEASHFAFGNRLSNGKIPVAVIAHDSVDWIRKMAAEVKLNVLDIVPEVLALPSFDDRWTLMTNSGHASVRLSASRGFSCDTDMLPILLNNALPGAAPEHVEDEIARTQHYCCGPDEYVLHDEIHPEYVRTEIALFAKGLSQYKKNSDRINLLQGEYSKTEAMGKAWKPWRVPAALAATLLALWGGASFLQFKSLEVEDAKLQQQLVSNAKRLYPDMRRPENDPVRQVRSRQKAGSGAELDHGSFVVMMSAIATALKELKDPSVTQINYKRGVLDIVFQAQSLQDVDKLKLQLEKENRLVADVRSANKEKEGIRANVRVEVKS